jgi:hypothetical protein
MFFFWVLELRCTAMRYRLSHVTVLVLDLQQMLVKKTKSQHLAEPVIRMPITLNTLLLLTMMMMMMTGC